MTNRITRTDLDNMIARYVRALELAGVTYDGRIGLDIGSKTYGVAYRLHRIPTGESGHWPPPVGADYLGMTAREAFDTLADRARTIEDVTYARRQLADGATS